MKPQVILSVLLLWILTPSFAEEITLADVSVSASVENTYSPQGFGITVIFRPVTTLDKGSNQEMTEAMAQFYAEEALSEFVHSQKAINFNSAKLTWTKAPANKVRCTLTIPNDAVIDAPMQNIEIREEIVSKDTRRTKTRIDTKTQLLDFRSSCFRDLRVAEILFAEKIDSVKSSEEREMLRQKIEDAFASQRKKIKADEHLFRAEKNELTEKVNKVENFLLARIMSGNEKIEEEKRSPIKEAIFKKPFGELLKSDPILLTYGGARFVEMDDGSIAILAVGSAMADNEDREDIAELQASAALGKLQAGEESVVANQLERTYRRSSGGKGATEDMDVRRTSTIRINSMDFHKCGETVGTWLSPDGRRFFVAKGRIIRKQVKERDER